MFNCIAGQNLGSIEPRLLRDSACGRRIIARDHHDPDSRGAAFPHGCRNARPQRIGEANQTEKHKRKVTLRFRPGLTLVCGFRHTQHAQALGGHGVHRMTHRFSSAGPR